MKININIDNINQIFKVPNTPQGRLFIELVKEYASPCYKVVCKGRTINHKKAKRKGETELTIRRMNNLGGVPIELADNIGVYLTLKNGRRIGAKETEFFDRLRGDYSLLYLKNSELEKHFSKRLQDLEEIQSLATTIKEISGVHI